jgi:hypothetical protein
VKSDLVRELGDAEEQLARYIGIATDGLDWRRADEY